MVRTLSKFFFFLLTRRPPRYTLFPTRRSSDLFVDIPGFVIGVAGEKAATIRHGARALAAIYQSKAPWCSILMRKSFGVAGAAHQNWQKYNFRYAWPSGDWGSLPLEGGIEAAYKAELAASPDPAAHLAA